MRKAILYIILVMSSFSWIRAQEAAYVEGELLVQLTPKTELLEVRETLQSDVSWINAKRVSRNMNVWKLILTDDSDYDALRTDLLEDERVLNVQRNHKVDLRATPDDPEYFRQWHLRNTGANAPPGGSAVQGADVNAPLAWDRSTGGVTVQGDTIVVCIVDDGVDTTHVDLVDNLWFNHNEIPDNGIDDDNNGYVDDYKGWNIFTDDDNLRNNLNAPASHGTSVAGMAGARGDNSTGISSINWEVKLMIVIGDGDEAEALESYDYPLTMRKRYNATNGAEGAYVVSINTSWGTDNGNPADAPIWCAFYDTMGQYGILNAAATTNSNSNVDVVGDLPTTCPSRFLVSVTSTTSEDEKAIAGFGAEHIDLGSPGELVYTTRLNDDYHYDSGTSFATPLVAGAIGILYASACDDLIVLGNQYPDSLASYVRNALLDGVDQLPDLDGITATGGRLNVANAVNELDISCWNLTSVEEVSGTSGQWTVYPNPTTDRFRVVHGYAQGVQLEITNIQGAQVFSAIVESNREIEVANFPSGMYLVSIRPHDAQEPGQVRKLVVR